MFESECAARPSRLCRIRGFVVASLPVILLFWDVLAMEVGGRFGPEAVAFLLRGCARPCSVPPYTVGRACWLWRRNACWLTRCLIFFLSADLFATGVQWSVCRKQRLELHAVFCEVSVLHARVQGCSSLVRGKTAGNRRSFVEASRGKDPAEQGLVAINIGGAGKGKTKETGADGFGGREGEQGGPTGSDGHRARRRTNWEASALQRPPTSSARITSRHGTSASAVTQGRCVPQPCVPSEKRRPGTGAGDDAQLH